MAVITETDNNELVTLLKALQPGFLPYDVFVQIARLVVLSIIEFVPLRRGRDGKIQVLLIRRPDEDPIWPGELHTPGTVVRPTDTAGKVYLTFERILQDELLGTKVSPPHYVGSNLHRSKRGMEQAQIYWVEVLEPPKVGEFYDIDNLPEKLMVSQQAFIKLAAENYKEIKHSS